MRSHCRTFIASLGTGLAALLVFVKAPSLAFAQSPPAVHIGLLKLGYSNTQETEPAYVHAFFFKFENGKYVASSIIDPSLYDLKGKTHAPGYPQPPAAEMFVTFDGKVLSKLKVSYGYQIFDEKIGSEVKNRLAWLRKNGRLNAFVTSSLPKFSDPQKWKKLSLSRADETQVFEQLRELTVGCIKTFGEARVAKLDIKSFSISRAYAPSGDPRRLVEVKNPGCVGWKGSATENGESAPRLWLFRSKNGDWRKVFGPDLIDIGDYNDDGASEAIFYQADETTTPMGNITLHELETFDVLATAHDSGTLRSNLGSHQVSGSLNK